MIFCPYQQVMRPQSRSALSSLSSLRENSRKALIAKIMTRFELLVSQISGLYISNMIHGRCTITEGSGGFGRGLYRRGNSWSQARIPGFWLVAGIILSKIPASWLVEFHTELWLAKISIFSVKVISDWRIQEPGLPNHTIQNKSHIYSNYIKYYFSNISIF